MSKSLLGIEEQSELHKLQFCPESHEALSDNLPVKLTMKSILSHKLCLVISLIHSTQTFEVWFEVLAEEQQVRAQMTSPLLTSGRLWLTYRLSLLVSIRFLLYHLRELLSKLIPTCLILNCPFSVVEKQLITAWYKTGNIVDWWKANQRGKRTKLFAQIWPKKTNFILVCWIVGEACNAIKWREITAFLTGSVT